MRGSTARLKTSSWRTEDQARRPTGLQVHSEPRVKKRLQCTLAHDARRHSGLILNLSGSGMFVQTSLPAEPGTLLDIDVQVPDRNEALAVRAAVVWRRRVSPRMTGVNQSGMGVRIVGNETAYREIMADILEPVLKDPSALGRGPAPPPADDAPRERFVLRLGQTGGPRSRRVVVESHSKQAACEEALRQAGDGWTILEIVTGAGAG